MINIILMVSLGAFGAPKTPAAPQTVPTQQTAQFKPCVLPNKCAVETPVVAQFKPCVLPNRCEESAG